MHNTEKKQNVPHENEYLLQTQIELFKTFSRKSEH